MNPSWIGMAIAQTTAYLRSPGFQEKLPWLQLIAGIIVFLYLSYTFARQLGHPSGWFGRTWMAKLLNNGNRRMLDAALRALDAKSGESIADIGFGGGYAIDKLLPLVKPAKPIGVEVSETMVDAALDKWDDEVDLYLATVTAMPLSEGSLDGVLSVNTIYFWPDPGEALRQIRRMLKPGGRLVLGVRMGWWLRLSPVTWFRFRLYSQAALDSMLRQAGFEPRFEGVGSGELIAVATAV